MDSWFSVKMSENVLIGYLRILAIKLALNLHFWVFEMVFDSLNL